MKKNYALIILFASPLVFAETWKVNSETDSMTDVTRIHAVVAAKTGDTFTILQRDDKSIWAYFELSGTNQFSVNDRLTLRVDKNEPISYNQDFQELSRELGQPVTNWEWNPNLISFELGSGKSDGDCHKIVTQIYSGEKLIIRYHPNQSTTRDVSFSITGGKEAISKAIDIKC